MDKNSIVIKFGGTSVGIADNLNKCIDIILSRSQKYNTICVLSAMSGVTNLLQEVINKLNLFTHGSTAKNTNLEDEIYYILDKIKNIHSKNINTLVGDFNKKIENNIENYSTFISIFNNLKTLVKLSIFEGSVSKTQQAKIMSTGELMSVAVVTQIIESDSRFVGFTQNNMIRSSDYILTTGNDILDSFYSHNSDNTENLKMILQNKKLLISTGFFGKNQDGDIALLGRGGSDYVASIYASMLDTEIVEIWTDVDGVYTFDPRKTTNAKHLERINFSIATEIASAGAKVLHEKTTDPLIKTSTSIAIKNTNKPQILGTLIDHGHHLNKPVVATKTGIILIVLESSSMVGSGFMSKITSILSKNKTNVDVCMTSEISFAFTINSATKEEVDELEMNFKKFCKVSVISGVSKISVIQKNINTNANILKTISDIFIKEQLKISISLLENCLTVLCHDTDSNQIERIAIKVHDDIVC